MMRARLTLTLIFIFGLGLAVLVSFGLISALTGSQLIMGIVVFFITIFPPLVAGYLLGDIVAATWRREFIRDPLWLWLLNPFFFAGPVVSAIVYGSCIMMVFVNLISKLMELLGSRSAFLRSALDQLMPVAAPPRPLFFALAGLGAYTGFAVGVYHHRKIIRSPEELRKAIREALKVIDRLLNRISTLKGYKRRRFDRRLTGGFVRRVRKSIPEEYWIAPYLPPEEFVHAFRADVRPRLEALLDSNDPGCLLHGYNAIDDLVSLLKYLSGSR